VTHSIGAFGLAIRTRDIKIFAVTVKGIAIVAEVVSVMRVHLLISALILGACAGQSRTPLPKSWVRADRQPVNSGLLDIDTIGCRDEMLTPDSAARGRADKGDYSQAMVDDFVSCMKQHGYLQIKS
jgi:hypothetical protein